ncbi:MAG: metallophosphoesterase [Chthoniobacterales bacterium]
MRSPTALPHYKAVVAPDVLLDGRLALFHQTQRWLAVADLHFGYELSQRAAGRLLPMWGMSTIEERLRALIADYEPRHVVIVGDVVHDRTATDEARELIARLGALCELIVLAGNHDRRSAALLGLQDSWRSDGFYFHHGHCESEADGAIQIIGHHHPTGTVHDGAGLRLKLPAFVQQGTCWILPAFSPWAAGAAWQADTGSRLWLCTPQRILRLPQSEAAPI